MRFSLFFDLVFGKKHSESLWFVMPIVTFHTVNRYLLSCQSLPFAGRNDAFVA